MGGVAQREKNLVESYKQVQKIIMAVGLCFSVPLIFFVFFMKDRKLDSKVAHADITDDSVSASFDDDPIGDSLKKLWKIVRSKLSSNSLKDNM